MKSVKVMGDGGYDVLIERGLIDRIGKLALGVIPPCTALIVSDDRVDALYSERLLRSLESVGYKYVKYVFPNGESSKNAATYIDILEFAAKSGLCRSDVIFALGGGVVGDLAGFTAATYLRGIRYVQVPTTLLAAVDSSVGGKCGIDLTSGKNMAGAFHRPSLVVCDPDTLDSLDRSTFSDGCAEVIKYGAISDERIFDMMSDPLSIDIESVIMRSVEIKRDVVASDEKESGPRKILNFGHTFGHAVEKCSGYTITHGSAVAIGMAIMTRGCAALGICDAQYAKRIEEVLLKYDLPIKIDYGEDELFDALRFDKKRSRDKITLVLAKGEAECELFDAPLEKAREILRAGL